MKDFTRLNIQEVAKKVAIDIANNLALIYDDAIEERLITDNTIVLSPYSEYGYSIIVDTSINRDRLRSFSYHLEVYVTPEIKVNEKLELIGYSGISILIHSNTCTVSIKEESGDTNNLLEKFNDMIVSLVYK